MNTEDWKKRNEKRYTEEARRACSIFPSGELVPHEPLDFLLDDAGRTLGIEVTELCIQKERADAARPPRVLKRAKEAFSARPDSGPVYVAASFSPEADRLGVKELADALAGYVMAHRKDGSSDHSTGEYPEGYCYIAVGNASKEDTTGRWLDFRGSNSTIARESLLRSRIAEKNRRVPEYRRCASAVWLLVVNDQLLGPGEVYVLPEDLARWRFDFDFDKVLLLLRGRGHGEVVELQRA